MGEALVRVEDQEPPLVVRINGPKPTFKLGTDALQAKALREVDPVLLDLMEIAATVFAADSGISRGGAARPGMGTRWYRRFDFEIPVRNPDLWQRPDVTSALHEVVETLTDDSVRFRFTRSAPDALPQPYFDLDPNGATFAAGEVVLFSGGLDSFAGALELLATTSSRVILVTHRSAQKAIPRQVELGQYLARKFPGRVLHVNILARRTDQEARDSTQRSRTLLFAALGQAVACTFGASKVSFFENGIVSHNLPFSPQIVGTMATRTTHPLSLNTINRLMELVLSDPAPIENNYRWLTKSEVVGRIALHGAAEQIPRAVSCTSIREQNNLHTHCGACTQCFDRRFAILHAGLAAHDPEEIYATDILFGERSTHREKTMAVEWTAHALRLGTLDGQAFMESFGHEVSRIFRGHPDLTKQAVLDLTLRMHQRHSTSVRAVLEQVLRDRAPDLAARRIPASSLLVLHLSSGNDLAQQVPECRQAGGTRMATGDMEEVDLVPQPGDPLQVAFSLEDGRHVVDVLGLATLTGTAARVPHALKPAFDNDRRIGTAPADYRYTIAATLPDLAGMSKTAIRQAIRRGRRQLADGYEGLHGKPPAEPLLIQSKSPNGYRLDPYVYVLTANQRS